MNLKIQLLIAFSLLASTSTINAMSKEEREFGKNIIETSIILAKSLDKKFYTCYVKEISGTICLSCKKHWQGAQEHAIDCCKYGYKIFHEIDNDAQKTNDPKLNLLFIISKKIAPLSMILMSLKVLDKIEVLLTPTGTSNIISDKEKQNAIETLEVSIEGIELINKLDTVKLETLTQDSHLICRKYFLASKEHFHKSYLSAIEEFQANSIPETNNPRLNLLLLVSRQIAPLSQALTSFNALHKIDKILQVNNQK